MRQYRDFKIEKNIPLPDSRKGRSFKYHFNKMEVGDSLFDESTNIPAASRIRTAASSYGKKHNMKFAARSVDGGVRIWRIK